MPFIVARVNIPISTEQGLELKAQLGQAIALVPGKSEEYLLVDIKGEPTLDALATDTAQTLRCTMPWWYSCA